MKYFDKIAVFDLDDTLYKGNSHIEWLCSYYGTSFFKSLFFRAIGRLAPWLQRYIIWELYERVDDKKKKDFILPFRKPVIDILREKQKEGFHPVIVSNAPLQLLVNAASVLQIEFLSAKVNNKGKQFTSAYRYDELFVCTDNKTDLDLIMIADQAVIPCKKKNCCFFRKRLPQGKYKLLIVEEH